jgi:hypothetical protein
LGVSLLFGKALARAAKLEWKGYHAGRRGLGTVLRQITGNSTAGRDVLGHEDEGVTKDHYPVGRVHQLEEPTCSSTIEHAQIAATVLPLVNFATSLAKESLKIKMPSK